MENKEKLKVAIFHAGKTHKLEEVIENVTSVTENEHCIIVDFMESRKGKRPRPSRQMFSKPEFEYVREFYISNAQEAEGES